jgi:hypothetical protein
VSPPAGPTAPVTFTPEARAPTTFSPGATRDGRNIPLANSPREENFEGRPRASVEPTEMTHGAAA